MPNDKRIENFLDTIFETSKLTGSKPARSCVCLFSFQCTSNQSDRIGWKCKCTATFVYAFARLPDKIDIHSVSSIAKNAPFTVLVL